MSKSFFSKDSLTILFILGLLVLVSTSILMYLNSKDQESDHDFMINSYNKIQVLDKISSLVIETDGIRRTFSVSGDKDLIITINSTKIVMDSLLNQVRNWSLDNQNQLADSDALKSLVSEHFTNIQEVFNQPARQRNQEKIQKNLLDKSRILLIDIRNQVSKMKSEEKKSIASKTDIAESSLSFAFYTQVSGLAISAVIFIIVFSVLSKKAAKTFELENQEISREELEQIVRERTAEISQINQKLYKKVDELENMEAKLKRSEEYYRMLFEQAHDAIIIFAPENETVLDVNKRACDMYGFTRDEFRGLSLKSVSKNIPQGIENVKQTLQKGYYHNFQSVHYKKDSTEMLIEINASVISYNGKPAILSINRDITDRVFKVA
jgi:PAS domain S-box-containing protein